MTNFEYIKSLPIEKFAEILDVMGDWENTPWVKWQDENYCKNCPPLEGFYEDTPGKKISFNLCEVENCPHNLSNNTVGIIIQYLQAQHDSSIV